MTYYIVTVGTLKGRKFKAEGATRVEEKDAAIALARSLVDGTSYVEVVEFESADDVDGTECWNSRKCK